MKRHSMVMVCVWQNHKKTQQKQWYPKMKHYYSIILKIGHSSIILGGITWKEAPAIYIQNLILWPEM